MISYDLVQQQPSFLLKKDGFCSSSRVHVLGVIEDKKCLLYSVATSKTTEIQLFNQYGISTTVIAFNKYMDIISADISFDVEMLIYTERIIIPSPNNSKRKSNCDNLFKYQTVLCNINSFSKLQVFDDYNPITSYFLPYIEDNKFTSNFDFYKTDNQTNNFINNQKNDSLKSYQFIHVIGDKVSHFRATIKKQKIYIRIISNGVNINKCQKWFFSKRDLVFYSFNEGKFSAYTILDDKKKGSSVVVESHSYKSDSSSILPNELALKPSTLTNLPYFKFSSGISYVTKINNGNKVDYGIIEQLYKGEDSFLTFSVATIFGKFKNIVTVKGIQPDFPISFLQPIKNYNAVFVFVPNCFISFIDFTYPNPHISMMPHIFNETSFSSQIVSNIDSETNFLTDLNSGKVFEISLNIESFPKSLHFADRTILSIISRLVTTFPAQVSITSAIENLPLDTSHVQLFFKSIFTIINQIIPTKSNQLIDRSESYSFHEANNYLTTIDLPRTKSDPTSNMYYDKLCKEDFLFSSSFKKDSVNNKKSKGNEFGNQNQFFKIDSKNLDESNNSSSSSSSNSSILSDKFNVGDKSQNISMNRYKYHLELADSIIKKANFVKLIHDNIELLFSSGKLSETRIFLIGISACFEAMCAKIPESSIFFNECSERSYHFCPLTIRQPFAANNLINYKYKSISQADGYDNKNLYSSESNKSKLNNDSTKSITRNINNIRKNEKNQMLYWKKKLCFLDKDEGFFTKKKSSFKRTKSNIYMNFNNYSPNSMNDKGLNSKQEKLIGELINYNIDDEKPKLITIPYMSRRKSSFNIHHACVENAAHI